MFENKHNCADEDQEEVEHYHEAIERLGPISVIVSPDAPP
jgi:hypothetical protein